MLGTFQSLALIHNKLKFYMYTRTLLTHTYYCFQYNDHNTIHNITLSLSYTHTHTHVTHTHARTHTRTHTHTHTHTQSSKPVTTTECNRRTWESPPLSQVSCFLPRSSYNPTHSAADHQTEAKGPAYLRTDEKGSSSRAEVRRLLAA